jgi:putative ABC transport system permease protein
MNSRLKISLKLAIDALRAHKTRAILTILGISIGISIIITIMSAGRGLDALILGELEVYSPDTLSIETKVPSAKKNSTEDAFGQSTGITITTLKQDDLDEILKHENISAAYGWVVGQAIVSRSGVDKTAMVLGEGHSVVEIEKMDLTEGRIFSKEEEYGLAQVAVLGSAMKEDLFGEDEAIGQTIYIKHKPFRVVGVLAKRGASFSMDMDGIVIIPTQTMQKRILGIDYMRAIIAKMKDGSKSKKTVLELEEILRDRHDITNPDKDDFSINSMEDARKMLGQVVSGITFLLIALVCISLIVGGVGIMNIMYVSVTERTFEIGLRKAVGAKSKDILLQFLSEAVLLTLSGGVVGILVGIIFAGIIFTIAVANNLKWVFDVPFSSILLSVSFSIFVGVVFGLYPARKAANLDPMVALRRE